VAERQQSEAEGGEQPGGNEGLALGRTEAAKAAGADQVGAEGGEGEEDAAGGYQPG